MNWSIHTKSPTHAADLRAVLETDLDELLGSEKAETERQAQIAQLNASAESLPSGEARSALVAAVVSLRAQPPVGIADKALRSAVERQAAAGIDAACMLAHGIVTAVVAGCVSQVDESTSGRCSVGVDFVDVDGLAARLAREPAAEVVITEGSVFAPPV